MEWNNWFIYLLAVIGLSLSPGPNGLLALTHGAMYGHKKAFYTVIGGVFGFVVLIALSMFGISAVLHASSHALTLLKWLGAGYLIWLGIQLWRSPPIQFQTSELISERSDWALFRAGFLAAISNPKVLLFFGAFLPQFINPLDSMLSQFIVMAATFAMVEFTIEYVLARIAFTIRPLIERNGKLFNQVSGGLFVLIGAILPTTR